MRGYGIYATYRGAVYRAAGVSDTAVNLSVSSQEVAERDFPDELARGTSRHTAWVKVPAAALDELVSVQVSARWRGQEVSVMGVDGDSAVIYFLGPPAFADAHGLVGDQHNGWSGHAPRDELTDVTEIVTAMPR